MSNLKDLVAQLPAGLRADWRDTNHFELTDGEGRMWLNMQEQTPLGQQYIKDTTDDGQRVGLLMDIAAELVRERDSVAPAESTDEADLCAASSLAEIAALPAGAVVTTATLLRAYRMVDPRGIKRMVDKGELPPPATMLGRHIWTAGSIIRHIDQLMQAAKRAAEEKRDIVRKRLA